MKGRIGDDKQRLGQIKRNDSCEGNGEKLRSILNRKYTHLS